MTVRLTPDTHLRLKAHAVKRNTTPAELAESAISSMLAGLGEPPSIYYEWKHRDESGVPREEAQ